jgi:glycosyltransferase involved in cell wall biosynthesis
MNPLFNKMKISVIIPCHNAGTWIDDALASVAFQTFPAAEVLVINDSSTDDSAERAVRNQAVNQVIHVSCRNAATARNIGIEKATGDWIAFLDADDLWLPDHLERATNALRGKSDIAYLAHNKLKVFSSKEASKMVERDTDPPAKRLTSGLSDDDFVNWWCRKAWFFPGSLVAKRETLLETGAFDSSQIRRHDFEMFFRLIHLRKWTYDPQPGAIYRMMINPESISSNILETTFFTVRALRMNLQRYPQTLLPQALRIWSRRLAWECVKTGRIERDSKYALMALEGLDGASSIFWRIALRNHRASAMTYRTARRLKRSIIAR